MSFVLSTSRIPLGILTSMFILSVAYAQTVKEQDSKPTPTVIRKEGRELESEAVTRVAPTYPLVAEQPKQLGG